MNFYVVFLASKRFVVIKRNWVQNAVVGKPSKVFCSPNPNAVANFNSKVGFYLNTGIDACYDAFVYKAFGKFRLKNNVIKLFKPKYFYEI